MSIPKENKLALRVVDLLVIFSRSIFFTLNEIYQTQSRHQSSSRLARSLERAQ